MGSVTFFSALFLAVFSPGFLACAALSGVVLPVPGLPVSVTLTVLLFELFLTLLAGAGVSSLTALPALL